MIESYFALDKNANSLLIVERSKFICNAYYVEDETQAQDYILQVKKSYPGATHNCYAYVTNRGKFYKSSDDGEPPGTAGQPILEVLQKKHFNDTLIVVTRYFGGTKLGTGGLVRAYSDAAIKVLEEAQIREFSYRTFFEIILSYDNYESFKNYVSKNFGQIVKTIFDKQITVTVAVLHKQVGTWADKLQDFMQGKVIIKKVKTDYFSQIINKR